MIYMSGFIYDRINCDSFTPQGVNYWKLVTDDFGNKVSVTTIQYPNPFYCSIVVQYYFRHRNEKWE